MSLSYFAVRTAACASALLFAFNTVHADDNSGGLDAGKCAEIAVDERRLACYDYLFRGPEAAEQMAEGDDTETALDNRLKEERWEQQQAFSLTPHMPNYMLPVSYNANSDYSVYGADGDLYSDVEFKLQLSLKTMVLPGLIGGSSLWLAYTQQSYWQLYADKDASAPFRETNYQPELIWGFPLDYEIFGMRARVGALALNHQSNGRSSPLSRSWNRVTGEVIFESENTAFSVKSWVRIDNPSTDDNPDIEDYMGRLQLGWIYKRDDHVFDIWLKNNLRSDNRSGLEVNWAFPLTQHMRGYVQLYSGYGENLIDMKQSNTRIGIGVTLTDWL